MALERWNKSSEPPQTDVALSIAQLLNETKRFGEVIVFVGALIGAPRAHLDAALVKMHEKEDRITVLVRESQLKKYDNPATTAAAAAARMNRNSNQNNLSSAPSSQQQQQQHTAETVDNQSKRPRLSTIGDDESELFGDTRFESARSSVASTPLKPVKTKTKKSC